MVDRYGETLVFTPAEQQEFNVLPTVSLESGEKTAVMFEITAQGLSARADFLRQRRYDGEARSRADELTARAARLTYLSQSITGLLTNEVSY
jgi:hypothetical protein